jgi:hypothetical protein
MSLIDKDSSIIQGWIRPLSMPSIRIVPFEKPTTRINATKLIRDLCRDNPSNVLAVIEKRYLRLSTEDLDIFIVPADNLILEKIVWPLKSAKQAFCLADFIGCIALCGMVCEMAIVFIYDLITSFLDTTQLGQEVQKVMISRRKFEQLGQKQRIRLLRRLNAIPKEFAELADTVREIRREYLHFLTKDYVTLEEDAFKVYTATFRVIKSLVALPLEKKGKVAIPVHLKAYLEVK